jgi:hypothetical protein
MRIVNNREEIEKEQWTKKIIITIERFFVRLAKENATLINTSANHFVRDPIEIAYSLL